MRCRGDFTDRQFHGPDISDWNERGRNPDAELHIELTGLIRRVAVDENVLSVQLNATRPRSVDLVEIPLEFQRNVARGESRSHRRDGSRCRELQ
jgi:hypothetical protein